MFADLVYLLGALIFVGIPMSVALAHETEWLFFISLFVILPIYWVCFNVIHLVMLSVQERKEQLRERNEWWV